MRKTRRTKEVKNLSLTHQVCAVMERRKDQMVWVCREKGLDILSVAIVPLDDPSYDAKSLERLKAFAAAFQQHVKEAHGGKK